MRGLDGIRTIQVLDLALADETRLSRDQGVIGSYVNTTSLATMIRAVMQAAVLVGISFAEQQPIIDEASNINTCLSLNFNLPGRVSFSNDQEYQRQSASYWAANQGEQKSACRVTPQDSTDLQDIMFLITQRNATFAIKSGGHSVVPDTSNIASGITIDLEALNHVTVNGRTKTVDVGTGARWRDVYRKLHGTDLMVAGARAGSVGVGGYLLGGGLSIIDGVAGWACDQIEMLEVVLSNGTLLELDSKADNDGRGHGDLFAGLRGGGSNFGIVTRFRLKLFENPGDLNMSFLNYNGDDIHQLSRAIIIAVSWLTSENWTSLAVTVGGQEAKTRISVIVTHRGDANQSQVIRKLKEHGFHLNSQRAVSQIEMAKFYDEMNPAGFRQHRATTTIFDDVDTLEILLRQYVDQLHKDFFTAPDVSQAGLLIQPLTEPHFTLNDNGGNMLGLYMDWSPLLLLSVEARHNSSVNDGFIQDKIDRYVGDFEDLGDGVWQWHPFKYLNYASSSVWPFELQHIWEETWNMLLNISRQYDSTGTFQEQMSHPFRISLRRWRETT